jgi:hypothetical protein
MYNGQSAAKLPKEDEGSETKEEALFKNLTKTTLHRWQEKNHILRTGEDIVRTMRKLID